MKKLAFSALIGALAFSANSFAAGDAATGKTKAAICAACHGIDGVAISALYPNLKGQNAPYLEGAIKAYRDGQRTGGMAAQMAPMAQGLSDQDIADLAAYFESLK
ncbi:c-type cytochrome [Halioxenophilus aromaticivorans]|uniref:C-type cytochrome n=1 Tax=Halioxenophilus aromaticivorans TaxID=1306992 RepID=A0AAV3U1R4_9ALTE